MQSIRPEVSKARVVAHWWPRSGMTSEPPTRVYTTEELDLSKGPASFRLEGDEAGFVIPYIEAEGRLQLFMPGRMPQGDVVQPPFGLGVGAGYVGTHQLRGRAVDKSGVGVPDIRLLVRDTEVDLLQEVTTGPDGRFTLGGFHTTSLTVTMPERGGWNVLAEFAGFRERPIVLDDEEVEIAIQRNPVVLPRLGATLGGTYYPAAPRELQTVRLLPDGSEQAWRSFDLFLREQKLRLMPGRWRLDHRLRGAESPPVETDDLKLDDVVEISFDETFHDESILVGVELDNPFAMVERPPACSVGAKHASRKGPWGGPLASARGNRCLLVLFEPGGAEVAGAIVHGDEVWVASPMAIEAAVGDRLEVRLPVQRAGGLHVLGSRGPQAPRRTLRVRDGNVPTRCMFEDGSNRMSWLSSRSNDSDGVVGAGTTWWLVPGRYTLQRFGGKGEPIEEHEVTVEAGQVTRFEETEEGLRRLP
ncbi:MAG: carboxypeptidase-like regulatory domain-containing protein [Planctomycetota bacterium]